MLGILLKDGTQLKNLFSKESQHEHILPLTISEEPKHSHDAAEHALDPELDAVDDLVVVLGDEATLRGVERRGGVINVHCEPGKYKRGEEK